MSDNNNDDRLTALATLIETGDDETPHPAEAGHPPEWAGDDDGGFDAGPVELPPDWQQVDPDLITQCAKQPQNDTGNGQRLLKYFGEAILNVREAESQRAAGWHCWTGKNWTLEGGVQAAMLAAQKTGARIALEADYLSAMPHEQTAMDAADDAALVLGDLYKKASPSAAEKKEIMRLELIVKDGDEARASLAGRQNKRRQFSVSSGNDGRLRAMLNQAVPHRTISQDVLDADPYAFNVDNGTLRFVRNRVQDLDCPDPDVVRMRDEWTVRLDPHRPDDLISMISPVAYREDAEAPIFLKSITRFLPNDNVRDWVQKYYGYGLTGLHGEQCLAFHAGSGSNWKSTFTEIIFRVVGDYGAMLKFESIAGEGATTGNQASPDMARLPRKRMVRASEPDRGAPLKEGLIKSITGGEPIMARHNFGNFFTFYPVFKFSLSGNHIPDIGGVDHGIWRRMRFVVWPVTISDDERREFDVVIAELWAEREGILRWLVEGALKYLTEGLKPPPEILAATAAVREDMDPVGSFLDQCVEIVKPPANADGDAAIKVVLPFESARAVYDAFVAWCSANAVRAWKEKSFATAMSQKGLNKERHKEGRRYIGVRLHDVPAMQRRHDGEPPHPADDEVPA